MIRGPISADFLNPRLSGLLLFPKIGGVEQLGPFWPLFA